MKSKLSIIIYFLSILPVLANQDIKVLSSNKNYLILEYSPSYSDTSSILVNNEKYLRVNLIDAETPKPENYGKPYIPFKRLSIGVPSEFGNTIQIISSEYKDISGKLAPIPKMSFKNGLLNYSYEINEKYSEITNNELISFGDYGFARDIPLQILNIYPVQFNPAENRIRTFTKIVFRVNYSANQPDISIIREKDDLLKDAVVNYNVAKNWSKRKADKLQKVTVTNSVLASGKWYRFEATEEGIYRIDRSTLSQLGIDAGTVDPRTIKIYNNSGKVLPENLSLSRPEDLQENAIYISGEEDGKFDESDFILLYGRGIHFWEYDSASAQVLRYYHPYSTKNYYWITSGGNTGKRMQLKQSVSENANLVQTTTRAYTAFEEDKSKLIHSGRLYLGDEFTETANSRTYMTKLDGLLPASKIDYKLNFVNRSERAITLVLQENGNQIMSNSIGGVGIGQLDNPETSYGINLNGSASYSSSLPDDRSVLKFIYNATHSPSIGYLNYFEIYYEKYLKAFSGNLLFFSSLTTSGIVEYQLNGFPSSNIRVFDVSRYSDVQIINGANISGGDCSFRVSENQNYSSKYIAVENSAYKTPTNVQEVSNSNLHGINPGAKFIIITHKDFKEQAERLKSHKENDVKVKVSTIVVDIDEIFNEFSCGISDVSAIRDFIKYAYDNWEVKPEYVLLFGDGDYDYKNIEGKNLNFIIPYESSGLSGNAYRYLSIYASDDFFARINGTDNIIDIALGRINILSPDEAKIIVDKIINYETDNDFGLWRNLITLVADDGPAGTGEDNGYLHTGQSEDLSSNIILDSYDQKKIYLTLYPTIITAIGRRKPAVNKAIVQAINEGTLILNWIGHGNPDVWAHEYVFEKSTTIPQLTNEKHFFLTAATCDFGRYDIPGSQNQSSTEIMLLKPDGGTIGVFTASSTVYSQNNAALNNVFYKNLLVRDTLNLIRPLGISYYKTKLLKYEENDLKFHLFGDPTLRLNAPAYPVVIDSINNQTLDKAVQIKALAPIKINGSIRNNDGSLASDFHGEAVISVFDSDRSLVLTEMSNRTMSVQGGTIFRGRVSIVNGSFSTEFTVPKDITYENKNGKISAYIFNDDVDGIGFTKNIIVGGTDTVNNDGKGPEIKIGFDNESFDEGYIVNPDFTLVVRLEDQTGLNTTGNGIGHKLEGILNNNENDPIDFTNYFVGDLNAGGKSGVIKYKFDELDFGDYTILVKAWDVFNNFSSAERNFTVVQGGDIVLRDVVNYPNPFHSSTTFTFQHNLAEPIDVKIKVYTVTGRRIKELQVFNLLDKFVKVDWDGRDDDGNILANGTYLYKVIVNTINNEYIEEIIGKLAVIK